MGSSSIRSVGPHRAAVRFVAVFLGCTFALLAAYRYAGGTAFMDRYLYTIASHTRAVLSVFGECRLEDPGFYAGREREVLERLYGHKVDTVTSLSPWQTWRYRALTSRDVAHEAEEAYRAFVTGTQSLEARFAKVETALPKLEPGAEARLAPIKAALAVPAQKPAAEEALRNAESRVAALLERKAVEKGAKAREEGPQVYFVARPEDPEKRAAFAFRVVADCGAVPSMAIFLSAVLAFPVAWRKRFAGLALGLPILYGINVLRLAFLAAFGAYVGSGKVFDFAHHYVWQGIYIVFVVALWLLWVEFLVREKPTWQNDAE